MNTGFGIDFGTTNSLIAAHHTASKTTKNCTERSTDFPHPSVVWYRLDEQPRVGIEAKRYISSYAEVGGNAFVSSVKRYLGKAASFDVFGEQRSAKAVTTDILRFLLSHARKEYELEVSEAVVTVPVYFDGRARRELRQAADAAGLYIKTFIHEPFAALIGYLSGTRDGRSVQEWEGKNILVFDWGGGTLDITIGRVEDGRVVQLATSGLPNRAGDYFDQLLGDVATRKFQNSSSVSSDQMRISPATKDRFRAECEGSKIALTDAESVPMRVAQFCRVGGSDFHLTETIHRNEFEAEIESDLDSADREIDRALEVAGLTNRQIELALLIGGTSRIPIVQQRMRTRFGHTMKNVQNANTIIAEGAAIADAVGLTPVFAAAVALELSDGTQFEVFKAGEVAKREVCNKTVNLFCTDNRDGIARLIVGLANAANRKVDHRAIITVPVSPKLPLPYNHERVTVRNRRKITSAVATR